MSHRYDLDEKNRQMTSLLILIIWLQRHCRMNKSKYSSSTTLLFAHCCDLLPTVVRAVCPLGLVGFFLGAGVRELSLYPSPSSSPLLVPGLPVFWPLWIRIFQVLCTGLFALIWSLFAGGTLFCARFSIAISQVWFVFVSWKANPWNHNYLHNNAYQTL